MGCDEGGRTLDDEIRSENTHGGNTDTRLGSSVRGTKAGEDDGCSAAHGTEERLNQAVSGNATSKR